MSENARYDEGYREGLRDGIELSKDCEGVIAERYERIGRDKGYAAGESERDALRAEVEMLRRALDGSQSEMAILRGALRGVLEWMPVLAKIEEAISEAGA